MNVWVVFIVLSRPVLALFNNHVECGVMDESGVEDLSICHLVLLTTLAAGNFCPDYLVVA